MKQCLFILVFALFVATASGVCCAAGPPAPDASASNPLRVVAWNGSLEAGINARYWTQLAEAAAAREWWSKFWAVTLGLFALTFPLIIKVHIEKAWKWWVALFVELMGVFAFGVTLMDMLDTSAHHNELASLQSRWAILKPEWDTLFKISHTLPDQELKQRIDALNLVKAGIVAVEPAEENKAVMHRAWVEEMHARDVDPDIIAKVEKDREALGIKD